LAHAVVHERAMMIIPEHAMVTVFAMGCAGRTDDLTRVAPPVSLCAERLWHHRCSIHVRVSTRLLSMWPKEIIAKKLCQLIAVACCQHKLPWRDDARITATCGQEEKDGCDEKR